MLREVKKSYLFVNQKIKFKINILQNMSKTFESWKKLHDQDNLQKFTTSLEGLLWLKIKSIARKELIKEFININKIEIKSNKISEQFILLFDKLKQDLESSHMILDDFIKNKDKVFRQKIDEEKLVSELYKLKYFDWGGDYKNALDRYLVDKYIKNYDSYDVLQSKLDTEINEAVRGYVFCSWYNHWSSILIENIFKIHPLVLATVGQIKKVDFFVNQIPFDLKVTYLPENFIALKRREKGLKTEISELKNIAKLEKIVFDKKAKNSQIYNEIVEKIKDSKNQKGLKILKEIRDFKLQILKEIRENPKTLIKNLYEEQGEMRFDASNSLFLILVDTENFENSWKLKRNLHQLKPVILKYLDDFKTKKLENLEINFNYKNKGNYTAYSDVILVER